MKKLSIFLVVCILASFVSASSIRILNPSFEQNTNTTWPGYCTISNWVTLAGSVGVDNATTWADNGIKPDRAQVAFMQNFGGIQQNISGLDTNKQYWLQLWFNVRTIQTNVCQVGAYYPDYATGNELLTGVYKSVETSGSFSLPFHFENIIFQPKTNAGNLVIGNLGIPDSSDVTVVFDALALIQRDPNEVVIKNPSFEASGREMYYNDWGYISNPGAPPAGNLAGWDRFDTCNIGVGFAGSAFNGGATIPEGILSMFIQSTATGGVQQSITGLTSGKTYDISYYYNSRPGNTPGLRVTLDSTIVQDEIGIVNQVNYYSKNFQFVASGSSVTLKFECVSDGTDQSVLIDDVSIKEVVPEPAILSLIALAGLLFSRKK